MNKKLLIFLIIGIILIGFISAQANYSKCMPKDPSLIKKMEKSIIRRILLSFLPFGWVNWLTGYTTYQKEIDCLVNETTNIGYKK